MGLKPSDIDWLIQSHLHQDHAGGIDLFAGTKAGSRIVVHRAELERALFNVFSGQEDTKAYVRADIAGIPGIKYHVIDEEEEFAPGIDLIHLPGHTPGVIGLVLHFKNSGTIILPSDAIYGARNFGPPPVLPGIFDDSTALAGVGAEGRAATEEVQRADLLPTRLEAIHHGDEAGARILRLRSAR